MPQQETARSLLISFGQAFLSGAENLFVAIHPLLAVNSEIGTDRQYEKINFLLIPASVHDLNPDGAEIYFTNFSSFLICG